MTYAKLNPGATDVNITQARAVQLGTVTELKSAHGTFASVYGTGDFQPETMAAILTHNRSVNDLYTDKDELIRLMGDKSVLRSVFSQVWPSLHTKIKTNSALISVDEVYRQLVQQNKAAASSAALRAYVEIILAALGSKGLIVPTRGFVELDYRDHRVATTDDFYVEGVKVELEEIFRQMSARVNFPANDMTAEVFVQFLDQALDDVLRQLEATEDSIRKISSALAITKAALIRDLPDHLKPAEDVAKSAELTRLMQDVAWVQAACRIDAQVKPERYLHGPAVKYAARVISGSSRLNQSALTDFIAAIQIEPIKDGRGNITDVTLTRQTKLSHEIRLGFRVDTGVSSMHYRFVELNEYAEPLRRSVSAVRDMSPTGVAHEAMSMALHGEYTPEAEISETSVHTLMIGEDEQVPIAAALSDRVMVVRENPEDEWSHLELVYYTNVADRRVYLDDLPIAGEVYSTTPATLMACAEEKEANVTEDTSASSLPADMFKHIMGQPVKDWFRNDYSRPQSISVQIGEEALGMDVSLPQLFAQPERRDVLMFRHIGSESVIPAAVDAIMRTAEEARSSQVDESAALRVNMRAGHALHQLLLPVIRTPAVQQLTDSVFRAIARTAKDRATRELTYKKLSTDQVSQEVRIWVALFILRRAHLIDDETQNAILEYFKAIDFYTLFATADTERLARAAG